MLCEGDILQFQNNSDPHFDHYLWHFGDGQTVGQKHPLHIYKQAGRYEVMLIGAGEVCSDTAYHMVIVDTPIPDFSFSKDREAICTGEHISFYPQLDATTLVSLSWDFGDGNCLTTVNETVQHAYDRAGLMPVQATARFRACPDLGFRDTVQVHPLPLVNLGADSVIC